MKCVCGYEKRKLWNIDDQEEQRKEELKDDFLHIDGTFLLQQDEPYSFPRKVRLYACPKCGTIKISSDEL